MNDTRDSELNKIGVLKRREIEARILAPLIDALSGEFGRERFCRLCARQSRDTKDLRLSRK